MIKAGIHKSESFNQTMFCYEILPPDTIKIWREDMKGVNDDEWWNQTITPQKFHWLVDEWNNGNIKKVYPHWWEKSDSRKEHINSLLQLSEEELFDVFNYHAFVLPHYRWNEDLKLDSDLRPLMKNGKLLRFVDICREEAVKHNTEERINHRNGIDAELYGHSDSEFIKLQINGYLN